MTAQEKAKEIVDKFRSNVDLYIDFENVAMPDLSAKQCALITAQEVLDFCTQESSAKEDFWFDVTEEIKKP